VVDCPICGAELDYIVFGGIPLRVLAFKCPRCGRFRLYRASDRLRLRLKLARKRLFKVASRGL